MASDDYARVSHRLQRDATQEDRVCPATITALAALLAEVRIEAYAKGFEDGRTGGEEAFAKIRREERERCAKLCDGIAEWTSKGPSSSPCTTCARSIRLLNDQTSGGDNG